MRKLIVSNLISIDGFFEAPGQSIDWFVANDEFFEYSINMLDEVDTILYGATTYGQMEAFWTSDAADALPAIKQRMNSLKKVVFSRKLQQATWHNTTLVKGDIITEVNKLKQQPGKDIVILGSGEMVASLTHLRLIDEYRLIVNPVILGAGTPLFKSVHNRLHLQLLQTKVLSNGVVILYYKPAEVQ